MQQTTEAIVLRRTDYGEADRIVTILTPELGRLGVLAKGVRKLSSKLAGGIEPLSVVQVTARRGRGELWVLTSSRMNTFFEQIVRDYERLQFAYVVLKKINQTAETLQDPALYGLLKHALASLNAPKVNVRLTEAWFHMQLTMLLGHGLNITRDVHGARLTEAQRYQFSVDDMSFVPHETGNVRSDHLKVLRLLQLKPPAVLAHIRGVERVIDDCIRLLRMIDE